MRTAFRARGLNESNQSCYFEGTGLGLKYDWPIRVARRVFEKFTTFFKLLKF